MAYIYWTWSKKGEHLTKSYKSEQPEMKRESEREREQGDITLETQIINQAIFAEDNK